MKSKQESEIRENNESEGCVHQYSILIEGWGELTVDMKYMLLSEVGLNRKRDTEVETTPEHASVEQ